jgi:hypothetical protein
VGVAVGVAEGETVGVFVGVAEGTKLIVGVADGEALGVRVGVADGTAVVGVADGTVVGVTEGVLVGVADGEAVGLTVGEGVGVAYTYVLKKIQFHQRYEIKTKEKRSFTAKSTIAKIAKNCKILDIFSWSKNKVGIEGKLTKV